ncbi:MAG TPA: Zn-dependent protease, partial [Isosphaeraceae bacterium]|nr:Zn-dependent protease [Isosphaeraceae bacterium]
MLGMPAPTAYDLNFRILGIPARISPWFWLGALLISPSKDPQKVLLFALCALVSILVHEYGHGLMARAFGFRAQVALFAL